MASSINKAESFNFGKLSIFLKNELDSFEYIVRTSRRMDRPHSHGFYPSLAVKLDALVFRSRATDGPVMFGSEKSSTVRICYRTIRTFSGNTQSTNKIRTLSKVSRICEIGEIWTIWWSISYGGYWGGDMIWLWLVSKQLFTIIISSHEETVRKGLLRNELMAASRWW